MVKPLLAQGGSGDFLALDYPPIILHRPRLGAHLAVAPRASGFVFVERVKGPAVTLVVVSIHRVVWVGIRFGYFKFRHRA